MKNYFKNKFFYIVTVIALILTIVPTVLCSMGVGFVLRDMVSIMLTPAQKLFNYAAEGIYGYASYFYRFDEITEENIRLKKQVAELQSALYDTAEIEEMYEWMSGFLALKMAHNDLKLMKAEVTGRESGNYSKILTLDVGTGAGAAVGMPVITEEGIVGKITEVGYNWSKVTTAVVSNSSVGAYVEKTGDSGICIGTFDLAGDGLMELRFLPADAEVNIGDRILSTGFGSVYPRGLTIGYIESSEIDDVTRSVKAVVKLAADLSDIKKVMVITSFEQVS